MKKFTFVLFLILMFGFEVQAQKEKNVIEINIPRWRVGVEAGVDVPFGSVNKPSQIRENRSYYPNNDYDYYCGLVLDRTLSHVFYFGAKAEYMLHKRWTVTSGLRLSINKSTLTSDRDYFLWKIEETETSANYIKIKNLSQSNYYLGLPIEFKFFPRQKDYSVRQYFIFGTSFNLLASSNNNIDFDNERMEKYSTDIKAQMGTPNVFFSTIYAGVGLKFGKMNHPFGSIEVIAPMIRISGNSKSFVNMEPVGFSFRTILQIPVAKKKLLTYSVKQ